MTLRFLQVGFIQEYPRHLHHSPHKLNGAKIDDQHEYSGRTLVVNLQSKGRKMILGFLHVGFIQGNSHTSHSLSPSPPHDPEIKHSNNGIQNPEPESWTISMSSQRGYL